MKTTHYIYIAAFSLLNLVSCSQQEEHSHAEEGHEHSEEENHDEHSEEETKETDKKESLTVELEIEQLDKMGIKMGEITQRSMEGTVETSGRLEVAPQNEAHLTTVMGATVHSIKVIEGDQIRKGQALAWIAHPDIIKLQTDYIKNYSELSYIKLDYERNKQLFDEKIESGKNFQKAESDYISKKGLVSGLEKQLGLLHLNPEKIRNGEISTYAPIISPISGVIRKVNVRLGQFVQPQTELIEIVNTDHVHADLMVFEKDAHKIKVSQKIRFSLPSKPTEDVYAEIYAVGKTFEENPKAIHIHADIENKTGELLPGTYIKGVIIIEDNKVSVLPNEAIAEKDGINYVFQLSGKDDHHFQFKALEVTTGETDREFTEIKRISENDSTKQLLLNQAYYFMAEMNKGEGGHAHHH